MSKYIYRQEIATLTELSVDTIRKGETRFGIAPFKQKVSRRCVRYFRAGVIAALRARGLVA